MDFDDDISRKRGSLGDDPQNWTIYNKTSIYFGLLTPFKSTTYTVNNHKNGLTNI
jgi:hypothetical protein